MHSYIVDKACLVPCCVAILRHLFLSKVIGLLENAMLGVKIHNTPFYYFLYW